MNDLDCTPAGYLWLADKFSITTVRYWRESYILSKGGRKSVEREGIIREFLPPAQDPGDGIFSHLEFALKREGLHLELLRKLLPGIDPTDFLTYVQSRPTGRYARILWFLFEEFTSTRLNLPDLQTGNYTDLLDPKTYVTGRVSKIKRQRINFNLLGTLGFAPVVRLAGISNLDEAAMKTRCEEIMGEYPHEIFQRAVRYLYAKESKSSHEIERETPTQKRAETFIKLLEQAWHRDFLNKSALVELQHAIVDPRYANHGWRSTSGEQIYVGETLAPGSERVHYIAPKPEDLDPLMEHFIRMAKGITYSRIEHPTLDSSGLTSEFDFLPNSSIPTLIAAAVISFTFNFLHPFSDGNGRIHRFLLHHVLARNGFGPEGIILPVSAVILHRPREYDRALESFSKPLMDLVEYTMDDRQRMTVTNDTADHYRYIDCTELCRITIEFIRETIETELPAELRFLSRYDDVRSAMRDIVELPDRIANLFILLCRQNQGTLSQKKRGLDEFAPLTDSEVRQLETVIREGFGIESPSSN